MDQITVHGVFISNGSGALINNSTIHNTFTSNESGTGLRFTNNATVAESAEFKGTGLFLNNNDFSKQVTISGSNSENEENIINNNFSNIVTLNANGHQFKGGANTFKKQVTVNGTNNLFDGNTHSINEANIYAITTPNDATNVEGLSITNSIFQSDGVNFKGILIQEGTTNAITITGNTLQGNLNQGIEIKSGDVNTSNNTITSSLEEKGTDDDKANFALKYTIDPTNNINQNVISNFKNGIVFETQARNISEGSFTNLETSILVPATNTTTITINNLSASNNENFLENNGSGNISVQRNKITHNNPANNFLAKNNKGNLVLNFSYNCITKTLQKTGLIRITNELSCNNTLNQIIASQTSEKYRAVENESEGLLELSDPKIYTDSSQDNVLEIKNANFKSTNNIVLQNGQELNKNISIGDSNSQKSINLNAVNINNKVVKFNHYFEIDSQTDDQKTEIINTDQMHIKVELEDNTVIYSQNENQDFKLKTIESVTGGGSEFVIADSIIQLGSSNSSFLFSKPAKLVIENENRTTWLVQRATGENFYEVKACSQQILPSSLMECYYIDGQNLVILTNHATVFAPGSGIPVYNTGGGGNRLIYDIAGVKFVNLSKLTSPVYKTDQKVSLKNLRGKTNTNLTLENQNKDINVRIPRSTKLVKQNKAPFTSLIQLNEINVNSIPNVKGFKNKLKAFQISNVKELVYLNKEATVQIETNQDLEAKNLRAYAYSHKTNQYYLIDKTIEIKDNKYEFTTEILGQIILVESPLKNRIINVVNHNNKFKVLYKGQDWYIDYMNRALNKNLIQEEDNPGRNVNRSEVSYMLGTLSNIAVQTNLKNNFKDITRNTPNKDAILTLNKLGILKGYEDGTFKPYKEINRAEALKIILESTKLIDKNTEDSKIEFTDVNEKDWYYKYVKKAYELEIVKGYEDGTFKPGLLT